MRWVCGVRWAVRRYVHFSHDRGVVVWARSDTASLVVTVWSMNYKITDKPPDALTAAPLFSCDTKVTTDTAVAVMYGIVPPWHLP